MRHTLTTRGLLFLCVLLLPWASAHAQWELDAQRSSINFVSIKNDAIGELHSFGSLLGFISADGGVQVSVDLNSVQTLIDIRNERMRELLFETVKFPTATVTAQIEPALLAAAAEGGAADNMHCKQELKQPINRRCYYTTGSIEIGEKASDSHFNSDVNAGDRGASSRTTRC